MTSSSKVKHIFLAEDDEDDILLFNDILYDISKEINVTVSVNGVELMNLLKRSLTLPKIIFLDLNMPLKNGFQCLQEIRSNDDWNGIKIFMYSTSAHPQQIEKAYQHGADLYFQKATNYTDFKELLKKCIVDEELLIR